MGRILLTLRTMEMARRFKTEKKAEWEETAPDITLAEHCGALVGAHRPKVSGAQLEFLFIHV